MSKLVLTDITSGYASTTATNANNTLIETALENTLSRDGTSPNQMLSDLDMNGHRILNSLAQSGEGFIWKGAWITSLVYALNNLVSNASSSYICIVAHTAGATFATDLAAGKWQLLAQQGLPGAGTGDMLVANNLSELTATKTTARGNISAASSGVNNDITQLTGLTTALLPAQGGTGITTPGIAGNILTSNGTTWTSAAVASNGEYRSAQVFTANGTYTKPAGLVRAKITVVGGGGGGGGGWGDNGVGAGGGAGGTSIETIEASAMGATETVTVGAAGTAGAAGGTGGNGATSSFGTSPFLSATGGMGGTTANAPPFAGPGGVGSGGTLNLRGGAGETGGNTGAYSLGRGGQSYFGGTPAVATAVTNGPSGTNGSGGSGGSNGTQQGGAGGVGLVYIEEYF